MKIDVSLNLRYGGMALLCLGPVMILLGGVSLLQQRQAQSWPTATARVVRSEVEVSKKASGFRRGTTRFSDYFTAAIEYHYVVNGKQFKGDQISFAESAGGFDRGDAERWMRQYPLGADLKVHYSPDHPDRSVIDPSPDTQTLALAIGFGVLAMPTGLVLRRVARRMQPAREDATPVHPPAVAMKKQARLRPSRPTHWLIRTLAVVTGLMFLLFGGLTLPVSLKLYVQAANAPAPGEVSRAALLVTVVVMGGITLLGAFLVWRGVKRAKPAVTFEPGPTGLDVGGRARAHHTGELLHENAGIPQPGGNR